MPKAHSRVNKRQAEIGKEFAMKNYRLMSHIDRAREEQAFYDAHGDSALGVVAKVFAVPASLALFAGVVSALSSMLH